MLTNAEQTLKNLRYGWELVKSNRLKNLLIRKSNAKCLDDESSPGGPELDFERTSRLPGEQYPPNKQCHLALGSQYKAYTSSKEPFNVWIFKTALPSILAFVFIIHLDLSIVC